ncbi:MAG: glycosyltransferase family 2 protein [Candidatus Latescibacteria bacterium]|nr:glycosyltransferase family 2 protein [Candidatus Latescibacterota bacterium]
MIWDILILLQCIPLAIVGFFLAYLAGLSLLALMGGNRKPPAATSMRKFALVVPAHNEETVIEKTLSSLLSIDYPAEKFDVVVVADNCSDHTAEIARELGAHVYERSHETDRGKGYALRWIFEKLMDNGAGYDAYFVIDADSIVADSLLCVLNDYMADGARAIQCSDMVAAEPGAWNVEVTRIGFALHNYARPLGRTVIGCPVSLYGNGMCFSAEMLREVPWQAFSLAEDLEYGLVLLLQGINVVFAPEAKVVATMPHEADNAVSQHSRWAIGQIQLLKKYTGKLFGLSLRRLSLKPIDSWIQLIIPGFVDLMVVAMALLGLGALQWFLGIDNSGFLVTGWGAAVTLGIIHVFAGLYSSESDRHMIRAFIHFPRYALWKILVFFKVVRQRRTQEWVRTTREESRVPSVSDDN